MKITNLKYIPQEYKIKNSRNPLNYIRMMKLYSKERQESFPNLFAIFNGLDSFLSRCGLRIIKDKNNKILIAYTYKLRKNKLEQKSIFIDALVRDRNKRTKCLMTSIYNDMKNIAKKKKAEEVTLFSKVLEKNLRSKYEKLGFKIDHKANIPHGYIMRVQLKDFLNSKWYKLEQYKSKLMHKFSIDYIHYNSMKRCNKLRPTGLKT